MSRLLLAVGCAVVAVSTGAAVASERAWVAPRTADARKNPLGASSELSAGGRRLFLERCAVCHGKDASGTRQGPNLTTRALERQSDGALFWKISGGNTRTGMPAFSYLPEAQRWQLVNHLRSVAKP